MTPADTGTPAWLFPGLSVVSVVAAIIASTWRIARTIPSREDVTELRELLVGHIQNHPPAQAHMRGDEFQKELLDALKKKLTP